MAEKVAVVVGGGSGMGAAAARKLAQDGFNIAILSSSGKGEALGNELGGIGVTGSNQSNPDLTRLIGLTMERWGRIDVLVNSAGHGPRAPILELTDEQWHTGLDVYLLNVIRATRLVAPVMVKHKERRHSQHLDGMGLRAESDVPHVGRLSGGTCSVRKAVRGRIRGQQRAHEQRPARMGRQLAGEGRAPSEHPDAAVWHQ